MTWDRDGACSVCGYCCETAEECRDNYAIREQAIRERRDAAARAEAEFQNSLWGWL
jgi:hypothetical protein